MEYEWDPAKAKANLRKHGVAFADAVLALEDPRALTVADPDASGEQRFVSMGSDPNGRVVVTVFAPRGRRTRIISSRKASRNERRTYESQ
jgi:uncharacterized DUF497 family protein